MRCNFVLVAISCSAAKNLSGNVGGREHPKRGVRVGVHLPRKEGIKEEEMDEKGDIGKKKGRERDDIISISSPRSHESSHL
jgi:hypothetical protein